MVLGVGPTGTGCRSCWYWVWSGLLWAHTVCIHVCIVFLLNVVSIDQSVSMLATQFQSSSEYHNLVNKLGPILENHRENVKNGTEVRPKAPRYATTFPWQVSVGMS